MLPCLLLLCSIYVCIRHLACELPRVCHWHTAIDQLVLIIDNFSLVCQLDIQSAILPLVRSNETLDVDFSRARIPCTVFYNLLLSLGWI